MIILLEEQNIVCFIKYIQRSKSHANQFGNVINANIGYSFDVEAVYLPGQWSYLLKRGNTARSGVTGIIGTLTALVHTFKRYSFAPFIQFQTVLLGSLTIVSDILVRAFGKNLVTSQAFLRMPAGHSS